MGTWNLKQSGKLICLAKPKHYLIMDHVIANFNFLEKVTINIPINGVYVHDYGLVCLSYCKNVEYKPSSFKNVYFVLHV